MAKIVAITSFRRGTGKTTIACSLAVSLAQQGWRVGLIDMDFLSPSIHNFLNLKQQENPVYLNDILLGAHLYIADAAIDVTRQFVAPTSMGKLYAVLASPFPNAFTQRPQRDINADRFLAGCQEMANYLNLDIVLIDTHSGLNGSSIKAITICDVNVAIMALDKQHYHGTAIMVDLAHVLDIKEIMVIANTTPKRLTALEIADQIERTYEADLLGIIPLSMAIADTSSSGVFIADYNEHPIKNTFDQIARNLMESIGYSLQQSR